MSKKKILIVMPALLGGGAERILLNVLKRVDYSIYSIDLVLGVKRGELLDQVPDNVRIMSIFQNVLVFRVVTWLQKKFAINIIQKNLFRKIISDDYSLGLCYLDGNMTDYLFFSERLKKRVTWVHSSYLSNDNFAKFYKSQNYKDRLRKKRYAELDKICFVSNDCKEEFVEVFGKYDNMEVIYNLVNTKEVLRKSKEQYHSKEKEFTFIAIGSLIPVKGYELLIESVHVLIKKGFKFKLQIIGKGGQKVLLEQMVRQKGLTKVVEFVGFTYNPYKYLKNADSFIMTSVSEANPTALCEALILGKPCVVVDVPGCREIIGNGKYGILVDRDVNEVAKGMEQIMINKELRVEYEVKAIERANDFRDDVILEKYFEIFNL